MSFEDSFIYEPNEQPLLLSTFADPGGWQLYGTVITKGEVAPKPDSAWASLSYDLTPFHQLDLDEGALNFYWSARSDRRQPERAKFFFELNVTQGVPEGREVKWEIRPVAPNNGNFNNLPYLVYVDPGWQLPYEVQSALVVPDQFATPDTWEKFRLTLTKTGPDTVTAMPYTWLDDHWQALSARSGSTLPLTIRITDDLDGKDFFNALNFRFRSALTSLGAVAITRSPDSSPPPNQPPTAIALSSNQVPEQVAGAVIGQLTTVDPDPADRHTYTLKGDRSGFEITGNTLKLNDGVALDFETQSTYSLVVESRDAAGALITQSFTIKVGDRNDAPQLLTPLPHPTLVAQTPFQFTIPETTFQDVDAGDTLQLAVTLSDGRSLPDWLTFNPVTRILTGTPTPTTQGQLSLQVTARDRQGASATDALILSITPPAADPPRETLPTPAPVLDPPSTAVPSPTPPAAAANRLIGTPRRDVLKGGTGANWIIGLAGNDRLIGNTGHDTLEGGAGRDTLLGNAGDDVLMGGNAGDRLIGGPGLDVFAIARKQGLDTIVDFHHDEDRIGLIGTLRFKHLQIISQGTNTLITLGNEPLALLKGVQANTLTATDFVPL
jgi:hypothetical protein